MIGNETSCAHGSHVQVLATGCFYLEEGVYPTSARSRCTFKRVPGHVDSGVLRLSAGRRRRRRLRRRCDGRWQCLVKPANCYRFIGAADTCREKKERRMAEGSSVTTGVRPSVCLCVLGKPNEDVRGLGLRKFVVVLCHLVACNPVCTTTECNS